MGIADFFRPKYRHSDARVRSEAVKAMSTDDAAILVQIAKTDRDIGVRRLAMERIEEAETLADIAAAETERSLRDFAGERAAELWLSIACASDSDAALNALAGIVRLGDQHALVEVVSNADAATVKKKAFGELRDPRALAELAKSDAAQELRIAAVARIDDGDVLRGLAIDTTQKEIGLAAVDKLDDIDRLEHVAQKAKNKAVRQRARKIVSEIAEAEKAKVPGTPDDVKRRRAEKAQLVREVEAVADSFDFAKASEIVTAAQAAFGALAADEGDEKFTKTVERFWRRKELHDQQARSSDELRAVEREAAAEKKRAATEVAAPPPPPPVVAESPEEAAKRAAREAEAKARRDEREAKRVEDEARKAAQAAERAAKQKEDAERGAAIAASLTALVADMDALAAQSHKDTRAIDRLLAQAGKGFEQIGKVAAAERDALAEGYRAARAKLVTKAGELREAEDWARWANVPKAEALIATAKEMFEAPVTPDLGNRLRGLQALWKEVGPMPQRRSKELWDAFKVACDQVYDKVRGQRAVDQEKFTEVAKVKEALIAEAEALADSTDFAATANRLKELQAQWKQSGHLPRKQGDELWNRFRAACDKFFARRKPELDARRAEEAKNLAAKHALIARAQSVAASAPNDGGWGKAITEIKRLQAEWKEIGWVPRRDADAVYQAFRTACDALFAKRDESRDAEANAHRAELDAARAEIAALMTASGDDVVARTLAVRAKAAELGALGGEAAALVKHVVTSQPAAALAGTELDPSVARGAREKLIARAAELLPKAPAAPAAGADLAAQLKSAMRSNAFSDLRFSGRDPIEVVDELRALWLDAGPLLAPEDEAQAARFESTLAQVLAAAGPSAAKSRESRGEGRGRGDDRGRGEERGDGEGGRRRRRDRRSAEHPIAATQPTAPLQSTAPQTVVASHDAITTPVRMPPSIPAPPVPAPAAAEAAPAAAAAAAAPAAAPAPASARSSTPTEPPSRPSSRTLPPPMDELDTGWDLGDEDPTAVPEPAEAKAPAATSTPSSSEMAGDGAVEGDGIDTGWD